jgi:hypothetical protein
MKSVNAKKPLPMDKILPKRKANLASMVDTTCCIHKPAGHNFHRSGISQALAKRQASIRIFKRWTVHNGMVEATKYVTLSGSLKARI